MVNVGAEDAAGAGAELARHVVAELDVRGAVQACVALVVGAVCGVEGCWGVGGWVV